MRARLLRLLQLLTLPAFVPAVAPFVPVRHWLVDLPACFPVQAALVLLPTALLLALARRWRPALVWALGGLTALGAVVPGMLGARAGWREDGAPLRVLSMNLLFEVPGAAPAAVAAIAAYDPDVLFCCELTPQWLAGLQPALRAFPYRCENPDPGCFGLALYSKRPLRDAHVLPLPYKWAPALRAIVETPAGDVGLLGIHTPRPGLGDCCAERDAALAAIPAALQGLPERRFVIGDGNATPWNASFRELLATTGLVDAAGSAWRPTWPTSLPTVCRVPIDHVLVGGGVGVADVRTGPEFGSDHVPMFAELRVPGPAK